MEYFNIALKSELEKLNDSAYSEFERAYGSVLNKHAPIKVKMLKDNNTSFMTKKQSCTDLNLKIISKNTALMKTGAIIKPNEITV